MKKSTLQKGMCMVLGLAMIAPLSADAKLVFTKKNNIYRNAKTITWRGFKAPEVQPVIHWTADNKKIALKTDFQLGLSIPDNVDRLVKLNKMTKDSEEYIKYDKEEQEYYKKMEKFVAYQNKNTVFKYYRATSKKGKYKLVKTISKNPQALYTYSGDFVDQKVKKGQTYYYKVVVKTKGIAKRVSDVFEASLRGKEPRVKYISPTRTLINSKGNAITKTIYKNTKFKIFRGDMNRYVTYRVSKNGSLVLDYGEAGIDIDTDLGYTKTTKIAKNKKQVNWYENWAKKAL